MVLILTAMSTISLFAMDNVDLKALYGRALVEQGTIMPIIKIDSIFVTFKWQDIFNAAEKTGLIAQYKQLLTSSQRADLIKSFANRNIIALIAFMQNKYGNGEPFVYNKMPLQQYEIDPVLGYYNSPKGKIEITWYSFFNGLLDTLITLSKDPVIQKNDHFKSIYAKFEQAFSSFFEEDQDKYRLISRFKSSVDKVLSLLYKGDRAVMDEVRSDIIPHLDGLSVTIGG